MSRSAQIQGNLAAVRERMSRACDLAGRDLESVTLIAVTKTFPASDIEILADLGVTDVGESKEQEGHGKAEALAHLELTWHFIGQLQRNKAKRVASWARVIHSVDRAELIPLLDSREVLIQVNLDPEVPGRGGIHVEQIARLAQQIAASSLRLRGLMAVAPLERDPAQAFAVLHQSHRELVATYPDATWISAGMSGDLEAAIAHGATHVRLGASILGSR